MWRRDNKRYVECGSKEELEYDHIIPVPKGVNSTERLQPRGTYSPSPLCMFVLTHP